VGAAPLGLGASRTRHLSCAGRRGWGAAILCYPSTIARGPSRPFVGSPRPCKRLFVSIEFCLSPGEPKLKIVKVGP